MGKVMASMAAARMALVWKGLDGLHQQPAAYQVSAELKPRCSGGFSKTAPAASRRLYFN